MAVRRVSDARSSAADGVRRLRRARNDVTGPRADGTSDGTVPILDAEGRGRRQA